MIDEILFRVRTGMPRRNLPERFRSWKTVYGRHRRWSADGTWNRILRAVQMIEVLERLAVPRSQGGRTTGFDSEICKRRNDVERTINRLRNSRAVAIRYDKRAYVFQRTVAITAVRRWLHP